MNARTVFIVGDSLFAEALAQMLARTGEVVVIGTAPTPEAALAALLALAPDAVIVAGIGDAVMNAFGVLLGAHPDLPMICADLNGDGVEVITSRRVGKSRSDLLAAIAALPKRS